MDTSKNDDELAVQIERRSAVAGSPVLSIDHVAIAVEDLESSIAWYEDMGLTVTERRCTTGERTGMISAVMQAGSATLVLLQGTSPESQVSRFIAAFGPGVQHLALAVTDLTDGIRRSSIAGALPETPVIEDTGIRQVFFQRTAATGVRIELIERRGGTFTDRSVERLFRTFEEKECY